VGRRQVFVYGDFLSLLEIIVLTAIYGPKKCPYGDPADQDRQWDEQIDAFHQPSSFEGRKIRCALNTTSREDNDIPSAATQGGMNPSAAIGIAAML